MEKFPIKIVAVIATVALLWWLWPSSDQAPTEAPEQAATGSSARELVSSIQPISQADAAGPDSIDSEVPEVAVPQPSKISEAELQTRFADISAAIKAGRSEPAKQQLIALIADYPQVVEPYINLASLQAESGDFDSSRATLERAIKANPNTATLFESVQKVYGAQAAIAYRQALSDQEGVAEKLPQPNLDLPLIESINTREARDNMIDLLRAQVEQKESANANLKTRYNALQNSLAEQQQRADLESSNRQSAQIEALQKQLQEAQQTVAALTTRAETAESQQLNKQQSFDNELASLRDQLSAQSALNQQMREREQALLARVEQQKADLESARRSSAKEQLLAAQERQRLAEIAANQLAAKQASERQELERQQRVKQQQEALAASRREAASRQANNLNEAAVSLVKSWAERWSAQDVNGYVAHYRANYAPPGSSLSNAQWLEQRRIRLTNKKFINVEVSEFSVRDEGTQFVVTFTQHYKSNTVDDRIRKRLTFAKQGNDLSNAKIVGEQVVRS